MTDEHDPGPRGGRPGPLARAMSMPDSPAYTGNAKASCAVPKRVRLSVQTGVCAVCTFGPRCAGISIIMGPENFRATPGCHAVRSGSAARLPMSVTPTSDPALHGAPARSAARRADPRILPCRRLLSALRHRISRVDASSGHRPGRGREGRQSPLVGGRVPWQSLKYDTNLGGYRTGITQQQLEGAPK
jgi:hypothetical protein